MVASDERLDEFWDIEKLLPQKPKAPPVRHFEKCVETVEIELDVANDEPGTTRVVKQAPVPAQTAVKLPEKTPQPEADDTYAPDHPLISQVKLYHWRGGFPFYERFCRMAEQMFDRHGEKCEPVPFFSYMPQYDQMNRAQLSWYLYWRDCVRRGEYPSTDYSYVFLFLFEIINLPGRVPPQHGQRLLCDIWKHYSKEYPLLHRYLADWICDYSLIHRLPPPTQYLLSDLRTLAEHSSLKEFYAFPIEQQLAQDAQIYLLFCCNYDYRKSKTYLSDKERAKIIERHVSGALSYLLQILKERNLTFVHTKMQKTTLCRDSFVGALCSDRMKRRIEVEYCSFQRSHELRFLITDIVKYSENKLRAYFGVKSKLTVYALPDELRLILDEYFEQQLPSKASYRSAEEPRPAYEALYDLPSTPISMETAARIEQASWEVTQRLVDAFEEEKAQNLSEDKQVEISPEHIEPDSVASEDALAPYHAFLRAVYRHDAAAQRQLAADAGALPDAMVESINVICVETMGDILIEEDECGKYRIIEEYEEELRSVWSEEDK